MVKIIEPSVSFLMNLGIFLLVLLVVKLSTMKDSIVDTQEESFYLYVTEADDWIIQTLDSNSPSFDVAITKFTRIYEQGGAWPWQKKRVGIDALRLNQIVEVKWGGMIFDSEIDAVEIIIFKDQYLPHKEGCVGGGLDSF